MKAKPTQLDQALTALHAAEDAIAALVSEYRGKQESWGLVLNSMGRVVRFAVNGNTDEIYAWAEGYKLRYSSAQSEFYRCCSNWAGVKLAAEREKLACHK